MATYKGKDCVLKIKAGQISAGGSFTELTNAQDVSFALSASEIPVSTRGSGGYEAVISGLKSGELTFTMLYDDADANFGIIKDGHDNETIIAVQMYPGDGSGDYFECDMMVIGFDMGQPLNGASTVDVSLKITRSDTAPSWN